MVEEAASLNLTGGQIRDVLLDYCALKTHATILCALNAKDFLRLPMVSAERVQQPDQ